MWLEKRCAFSYACLSWLFCLHCMNNGYIDTVCLFLQPLKKVRRYSYFHHCCHHPDRSHRWPIAHVLLHLHFRFHLKNRQFINQRVIHKGSRAHIFNYLMLRSKHTPLYGSCFTIYTSTYCFYQNVSSCVSSPATKTATPFRPQCHHMNTTASKDSNPQVYLNYLTEIYKHFKSQLFTILIPLSPRRSEKFSTATLSATTALEHIFQFFNPVQAHAVIFPYTNVLLKRLKKKKNEIQSERTYVQNANFIRSCTKS